MPQPGREAENREAYRYASLGMQFAGGTLFFAGMGFLLDRWLHILPGADGDGTPGRWRTELLLRVPQGDGDEAGEGPQGQGRVSLLPPGAALVALVVGLSALLFGGQRPWLAAGAFGLLALGHPGGRAPAGAPAGGAARRRSLPGWLWGMALRFGGVILLAVAVLLNRTTVPAAARGAGISRGAHPLLVLELRTTR